VGLPCCEVDQIAVILERGNLVADSLLSLRRGRLNRLSQARENLTHFLRLAPMYSSIESAAALLARFIVILNAPAERHASPAANRTGTRGAASA
jgi:hypothetical protein